MDKILHVVSSMNPVAGGVCTAVQGMVGGLKTFDIHSDIVCTDDPGESFLQITDLNIIALGRKVSSWSYSVALLPFLKKNLIDYDAVIIHGLWQYQSFALYKAKKKIKAKNIPIYVMPHGMLDPYFQNAPGRKLKSLRNKVFWNIIERNLIKISQGVFFTCEQEKLLARTTFNNYCPKNETVIGLGVEKPPTYNLEMGRAFKALCPNLNERPFILFLSRIDSKKGVDILVDAYLEQLKKTSLLPDLVIAGPGLETPLGQLLMNKCKNNDRIHFPNMLRGDVKWGAFYNCDAFILPSHQENFGIAVVEALACGKPVLISNQVNIFKEIVEGHAGFANDDNLKGTLGILEKWVNLNTMSKAAMNSNAIKVYENNFTIVSAAQKLRDALNAI